MTGNIEVGEIFKTLFTFAAVVLLVDFMGLVAWAFSGQYPTGEIYVGTISTHIYRFLTL